MTRIDQEIKLLKWIAVIALAVIVAVVHTLVVTAISTPYPDHFLELMGKVLFRLI